MDGTGIHPHTILSNMEIFSRSGKPILPTLKLVDKSSFLTPAPPNDTPPLPPPSYSGDQENISNQENRFRSSSFKFRQSRQPCRRMSTPSLYQNDLPFAIPRSRASSEVVPHHIRNSTHSDASEHPYIAFSEILDNPKRRSIMTSLYYQADEVEVIFIFTDINKQLLLRVPSTAKYFFSGF